MNQRNDQKNGIDLRQVFWPMCLMLAFCAGCQIASPDAADFSSGRSISQIAEESIQAASNSEFGAFETIGTPNAIPVKQSNRSVSDRSPTVRPAKTPGPNGRVLVDEIFDQTDIREALQAIASQANASIIVDDQVAGSVSALIQNEPLENAIRKLLLPLGLHYRVINGEYLVCNSDPTSPMFSIVAERLDYAPIYTAPSELVELLAEKNRQFVRVAPKRNILIIEAPAEIAYQILEEVKLFDRPVPQVVLEAMVVVVSPDSGFQFGSNVQQGIAPVDGDASSFNLALDGLALTGNLTGAVARDLFRRFSITSFFVRALEQEGYLSIRATPHVMAKHGEKAEISIARETFFSTQPNESSAFFRTDIQKVEAGISLIITPTIRSDNVTMLIEKAEVSEDIRASATDPAVNNPFPLINRRQVSTTVNVKDGETIVIGGLMQNQLVDRVSSVPVLGSLPLVGRFFTQIIQEEQAAEVVVFISPRIVNQSHDHPFAGSEQQAQYSPEFRHQRSFPRNNGLQIGGPVPTAEYQATGAYAGQQHFDPAYQQTPTSGQYQQPVYQQQPVYPQQPVHQQQPAYQPNNYSSPIPAVSGSRHQVPSGQAYQNYHVTPATNVGRAPGYTVNQSGNRRSVQRTANNNIQTRASVSQPGRKPRKRAVKQRVVSNSGAQSRQTKNSEFASEAKQLVLKAEAKPGSQNWTNNTSVGDALDAKPTQNRSSWANGVDPNPLRGTTNLATALRLYDNNVVPAGFQQQSSTEQR